VPAYPVISEGPCTPWAEADDVQGASSIPESADVIAAIDAASYVLWAMTARQFSGGCIGFVRPCGAGCAWGLGDSASNGVNLALAGADWWFGWGGGGGGGGSWGWWNGSAASCGCKPLSQIMLAGYPITGVKEVVIDGEVVDPSGYRIDFNRYLVRLADEHGNSRYWPACQDLDRAPGQPHTFSVEYFYGAPPPTAGKLAACELAVQFWLAINNPAKCTLPTGVTKLTRQGVTIERLLPMFGKDARTGLPMTDAFLAATNPHGLRRRPAVRSPGYPRYPRRTAR
jgi:hypothetical protein